jgi:hypothetical protein
MRALLLPALLVLAAPAFAGDLPDPALTPGAVMTTDTAAVCTPGYSKSVRHVSGKVKAQVYAEYGIVSHRSGEYEVDHLISLELGGSNDIKNLWQESYQTEPWNARVKDKLEDRLHSLVCSGRMRIEEAQQEIARDWIAAYPRFIGAEASRQ